MRSIAKLSKLDSLGGHFDMYNIIATRDMYAYRLLLNSCKALKTVNSTFLDLLKLERPTQAVPACLENNWVVQFSQTNYDDKRISSQAAIPLNEFPVNTAAHIGAISKLVWQV